MERNSRKLVIPVKCISLTTLFKHSQLNVYFDKLISKNTINLLMFETLLKMGPIFESYKYERFL